MLFERFNIHSTVAGLMAECLNTHHTTPTFIIEVLHLVTLTAKVKRKTYLYNDCLRLLPVTHLNSNATLLMVPTRAAI